MQIEWAKHVSDKTGGDVLILAPLAVTAQTSKEARDLLGRLKGRAALEGFRGAPAADMDRLADIMVRLSEFAADQRDVIAELDVNPIIIAGSDAVAVDALIVKA
jgi:acetyl-CoA synthetase